MGFKLKRHVGTLSAPNENAKNKIELPMAVTFTPKLSYAYALVLLCFLLPAFQVIPASFLLSFYILHFNLSKFLFSFHFLFNA